MHNITALLYQGSLSLKVLKLDETLFHLRLSCLVNLRFSVNVDRVRTVSMALDDIGWDGFVRLDMLEPEFSVLSEVYH